MADLFPAGGPGFIGLHRLVTAADGSRAPELAALVAERAGRSAEIIPFPDRKQAVAARRRPLFCEICRFPAIFRPVASARAR